jgi:hypothetical protein
MYMQALSIAPPAAPAGVMLSERQRYRLDTVNLIIKSLAASGLRTFGRGDLVASLEPKRLGGFYFSPPFAEARAVDLESPVVGRARLLPGFNGTYAAQRLVRCLAAYVAEGRSVPAATLAQALLADGSQLMEEFRFTKAFAKPIEINGKAGPKP